MVLSFCWLTRMLSLLMPGMGGCLADQYLPCTAGGSISLQTMLKAPTPDKGNSPITARSRSACMVIMIINNSEESGPAVINCQPLKSVLHMQNGGVTVTMCQPLSFNQRITLVRQGILAYPYITVYLSWLSCLRCFPLNRVKVHSYPLDEMAWQNWLGPTAGRNLSPYCWLGGSWQMGRIAQRV